MAHQLGRTELEKLAPLRGYCFGRTGLSFGRKKWLAPPQKCPKNAYAHPTDVYHGPGESGRGQGGGGEQRNLSAYCLLQVL